MTDKVTISSRFSIEANKPRRVTCMQKITKRSSSQEITRMRNSEVVVGEAIDVRYISSFLYYLEILNKLLLLQRKHSKYLFAKCLNFPSFIKKFGCMLACILHVLSARLTRVLI